MSTPRYRSEPPSLSGSAISVSNATMPSSPGTKSDIRVPPSPSHEQADGLAGGDQAAGRAAGANGPFMACAPIQPRDDYGPVTQVRTLARSPDQTGTVRRTRCLVASGAMREDHYPWSHHDMLTRLVSVCQAPWTRQCC